MAKSEVSVIDTSVLGSLVKPDDIVGFFRDNGIDLENNEVDGIRSLPVVDKETLLGRAFLAIQWRFNTGDFGDFVSVEIMLPDGTLGVINDGSTGLRDQFRAITDTRERKNHPTPYAGRMVKGLTKTDYYYNAKTGQAANRPDPKDDPKDWTKAHTYYAQF